MNILISLQCGTILSSLTALYNKTHGPAWAGGKDWFNSTNFCQWSGISCDDTTNEIIEINLENFGLIGPLPDEIGCFPNLKSLILSGNSVQVFSAQICIYYSFLQFFMASNANISGSIPTCLCSSTSLQYLYLDGNNLNGSVPSCLTSIPSLDELALTCNKVSGEMGAAGPMLTKVFAACTEIDCSTLPDNAVCGVSDCSFCSMYCPANLEIPVCGTYYFVPRQ